MILRRNIRILVSQDNVEDCEADVLALKYAQSPYGTDELIANKLLDVEPNIYDLLPPNSGFRLFDTRNVIKAKTALFIGVNPLREFGYKEIRDFGKKVLTSLAAKKPDTRHLCITLHGPGYGLDEFECFYSEFAGLLDAISTGDFPNELESITFVELSWGRCNRLRKQLSTMLPNGYVEVENNILIENMPNQTYETLRTVGYSSSQKPRIFVAMPFNNVFEDVYQFGIYDVANTLGFLCERIDKTYFTGAIIDQIKMLINESDLVIADLSNANPNVYLEAGYAWGQEKPTIFLTNNIDELKFDVQSHNCIDYKNIVDLKQRLYKHLEAFKQQHHL